jgi:hypothetical protein
MRETPQGKGPHRLESEGRKIELLHLPHDGTGTVVTHDDTVSSPMSTDVITRDDSTVVTRDALTEDISNRERKEDCTEIPPTPLKGARVSKTDPVVSAAFMAYLEIAEALNLPQPRGNDQRFKALARILKQHGAEGWQFALDQIQASAFLRGEATSFRLGIDWLLKPGNFHKVIEGNYRGEGGAQRANPMVEALARRARECVN